MSPRVQINEENTLSIRALGELMVAVVGVWVLLGSRVSIEYVISFLFIWDDSLALLAWPAVVGLIFRVVVGFGLIFSRRKVSAFLAPGRISEPASHQVLGLVVAGVGVWLVANSLPVLIVGTFLEDERRPTNPGWRESLWYPAAEVFLGAILFYQSRAIAAWCHCKDRRGAHSDG